MKRRTILTLAAAFCLTVVGCSGSDPTGTDDPVDVTGTWTGSLSFVVQGQQGQDEQGGVGTLQLTQSGTTVTGTHSDPEGDTGTVAGTNQDAVLLLVWHTDDTHPDCITFEVDLIFSVSNDALDLIGASGSTCAGPDGGTVTGGSGRLVRQ